MDPVTEVPVVPTPKPGWQSTEFAAAVLAAVGIPALSVPPQYLPYVVGIAAIYIICRTVLKAAHAYGYAKEVPDLPPLPPLPALPPVPAVPPTSQVPK